MGTEQAAHEVGRGPSSSPPAGGLARRDPVAGLVRGSVTIAVGRSEATAAGAPMTAMDSLEERWNRGEQERGRSRAGRRQQGLWPRPSSFSSNSRPLDPRLHRLSPPPFAPTAPCRRGGVALAWTRGSVGLGTASVGEETNRPHLDEIDKKCRIEMRTEEVGVHSSFSIALGLRVPSHFSIALGLRVPSQNVSLFGTEGVYFVSHREH